MAWGSKPATDPGRFLVLRDKLNNNFSRRWTQMNIDYNQNQKCDYKSSLSVFICGQNNINNKTIELPAFLLSEG